MRYGCMARHKRIQIENEGDPSLDISSLIDVCFLLLIYFIVTSTIAPEEKDLAMALPGPITEGKTPPIPPMVLRINDQGVVISGFGDDERTLDSDPSSRDLPILISQLQLYAAAAKSSGDIPSVMLQVDENVGHQRMIDVLNAFAATGISSVAFNDLKAL
jgi:biopolymer transport protein ExbD